jgi:hypothetical protein
LVQRWNAVHEGAGAAIDWVLDTSKIVPRLEQEAPSLVEKLRRARNQARRLAKTAARPVTVGLFGLSQAGKSYLISALAADRQGRLETEFDGERLDFLQHINPPGGGSEATGLVTRFTRTGIETPHGYPIKLTLMTEADIVKVLGNSFFNDFDREKVNLPTDGEHVLAVLRKLDKRRHDKPVPGLSADDVVDLQDYFQDRFTASMAPLKADYWPHAMEWGPYLAPPDRAQLFAVLWGEIPQFTETYLMLRNTLEQLSFAQVVHAPLDALVERTPKGLTQANSIMNVATLERLGSGTDDTLQVCPWCDGTSGEAMAIPRALLAALTAEIAFPLVEAPRSPVFDRVDVLDFPGYRGRLKLQSLDDVRAQVKRSDANPVTELVLRGKVAYLFERYTDNQEMNILIFCTPSDYQSEVVDVGPVLDRWITRTQGATPDERAKRPSGLVWAITKFDKTLTDALPQSEDQLRIRWGDKGLMNRTLLERFGNYPWMREWRPGTPFNQVFLVRKPGWAAPFLEIQDGREAGFKDTYLQQLQLMRQTFIEDATVQRHVHEPARAWDAMMALDEGGLARLSAYLETVADVRLKLERIAEQLDQTVHTLCETELGRYFQREGEEEVARKQKIAQELIGRLKQRASLIGELLFRLEPSTENLKMRYLRAESEDADAAPGSVPTGDDTTSPVQAAPDGLIDLNLGDLSGLVGFGADTITQQATAVAPAATSARFAHAVMQEWVKHLRELPGNDIMVGFLGFGKACIESLIDELIGGANRLRLQERMVAVTSRAERDPSVKRGRIVDRQVLAVRTVITDYIAWLGNDGLPLEQRANSPTGGGRKLFQPPPAIPDGALPALPEQPLNYTALYLLDWMEALGQLVVGNANHSGVLPGPQNAALGLILNKIAGRASRLDTAAMPAASKGQT